MLRSKSVRSGAPLILFTLGLLFGCGARRAPVTSPATVPVKTPTPEWTYENLIGLKLVEEDEDKITYYEFGEVAATVTIRYKKGGVVAPLEAWHLQDGLLWFGERSPNPAEGGWAVIHRDGHQLVMRNGAGKERSFTIEADAPFPIEPPQEGTPPPEWTTPTVTGLLIDCVNGEASDRYAFVREGEGIYKRTLLTKWELDRVSIGFQWRIEKGMLIISPTSKSSAMAPVSFSLVARNSNALRVRNNLGGVQYCRITMEAGNPHLKNEQPDH